jgi:SAM-dependent methyltransferase
MYITESLLYVAARLLYRSELAHSRTMKDALSDPDKHRSYRSNESEKIVRAAERYGVPIAGRVVLDLGCNFGAISPRFLEHGAERVIGVDINAKAIERARLENASEPRLSFHQSGTNSIPLPDDSVDTILSHDVFEHISKPAEMLLECHRVLRPSGKLLIGTWGWRHPYAPHLWSTMPLPWAHCLVSERTLLRACRKVYDAPWYTPTIHDLDENGMKIKDKLKCESISTDFVNKLLLRDFERIFRESPFEFKMYPQSFGSRYARWSRIFLKAPYVREFITAYFWAVLTKSCTQSR